MISGRDLAKMRAEQERMMPETVYVQRLTRTGDGAGGWSEVWATSSTVKGRIVARDVRSGEEVQGGAITATTEFIVTVPHNADVLQTDRLQINGEQYEVKYFLKRSEQTALRIVCGKID